jgi:Na+-translocating ferredoxin:NAD+ oxidoreductase RNF subunit RnfB
MDFMTIIIAMVSLGGLGMIFSVGLSIANKKLYVEEDPRLAEVLEELPGVNCGGCGLPGCAAFAEAVVTGEAEISGCPVNSNEGSQLIAEIMGIEVTTSERLIARVMCQGGDYETAKKGVYQGVETCIGATFAGGGDKLCSYGCIGYGDCVDSCPFDAMYMNKNGLPVVIDDKCTGCGNCVDACPRDIMELHPESHKLFVLCKNQDSPKESRKICTRACIGCGICVREAGEGNMEMKDGLAIVNYNIYGSDPVLPTEKCPTYGLVVLGGHVVEEKQSA